MDQQQQSRWQAFALTGDIRQYLSYKQQSEAAVHPAQEGASDGLDRNTGAGASGDQIR